MRLIGWFFAACMAIALLRLAVAVLVIAFTIALLIGLWVKPVETIGFVLFSALLGWAGR